MPGSPQQGRTRVVVTALLVLLIGTIGALMLPRLLQEAGKPTPRSVRGHICLEVPPDGLAREGDIALVVDTDDGRSFTWVHRFLAGATNDEVREAFAQQIEDTAVALTVPPELSQGCLPVGRVTGVGGDPGTSGVGLSFGLAAAPGAHLRLRIEVEGGPEDSGGLAWKSEVGLVAWCEDDSADLAVETAWGPAADVLSALADALRARGWGFADAAGDALTLEALPGGLPIGSFLLTVQYERTADGTPVPEETYAWSIAVR